MGNVPPQRMAKRILEEAKFGSFLECWSQICCLDAFGVLVGPFERLELSLGSSGDLPGGGWGGEG